MNSLLMIWATTRSFKWEIDWGDGTSETIDGGVNLAYHVYSVDGDYQISVVATDEDGTHAPSVVSLNNGFGNRGIASVGVDNLSHDAKSVVIESDGSVLALSSVQTQEAVLLGGVVFSFQDSGSISTIENNIIFSNELFEVESGVAYRLTAQISAGNGLGGEIDLNAQHRVGYAAFDLDGNLITSQDAGSELHDAVLLDGAIDTNELQTYSTIVGSQLSDDNDAGFPPGTAFISAFVQANENTTENRLNISGVKIDPIREFTGSDISLTRFDSNGLIDESFGTDGIVLIDLGTSNFSLDHAASFALQEDGKIVISGRKAAGDQGNNFALVRLNTDGTLDTSFGNAGIVETDLVLNSNDVARSVVIANGTITIAGNVYDSANKNARNDFAIVRYELDGSLDSTFGVNGKVVSDFSNSFDDISEIAYQADGKLVVVGRSYNPVKQQSVAILARYTSDGQLDPTFGENASGFKFSRFGGDGVASGKHVVITDENELILVGESDGDIFVSKYSEDGFLDLEFGVNGYAEIDFGGVESVQSSVLLASGHIAIAGTSYQNIGANKGQSTLAIAILDSTGILDDGFGQQGRLLHSNPGFDLYSADIAATDRGSLIVSANRNSIGSVLSSEQILLEFQGVREFQDNNQTEYLPLFSPVILGDINRDGVVDLLDVDPFVELVELGEYQLEGDINQDGEVGLLDVDPFLEVYLNHQPILDLDSDDSTASGLDYVTTFATTGEPVAVVDTDATLEDIDDAEIESLTVTLVNPRNGQFESLSLRENVSVSYGGFVLQELVSNGLTIQQNGPHQIKISGSGTAASYLNVIKNQIVYDNTSTSPNTLTRTITFVANDGTENSQLAMTNVLIVGSSELPIINFLPIDDVVGTHGSLLNMDLNLEYGSGDLANLVVEAVGSPTGVSIEFDTSTGIASLEWELPTEDVDSVITIEARDATDSLVVSRTSFLVSSREVNDAPEVTPVETIAASIGLPILFTVSADDDGGDYQLKFELGDDAPTGASINPYTGNFLWSPDVSHAGTSYTFTINVTDSALDPLTSATQVTIDVGLENDGILLTLVNGEIAATDEDRPLAFAVDYPLILSNANGEDDVWQISISPANGEISADTTGASIIFETPDLIVATGTAAQLNQLINSVVFTPAADFHGQANIDIDVVDYASGQLLLATELPIQVNSIVDDPIIASGQEFFANNHYIVGHEDIHSAVGIVQLQDEEYDVPFTFAIVGGNDDGNFQIDAVSGEITAKNIADITSDSNEVVLTIRTETSSGQSHEIAVAVKFHSLGLEPLIRVENFKLVSDNDDLASQYLTDNPVVEGSIATSLPDIFDYVIEFDLNPDIDAGGGTLISTDHTAVVEFDPNSAETQFEFDLTQFAEFPLLGDEPGIKTVAYRVTARDVNGVVIEHEINVFDDIEDYDEPNITMAAQTSWQYLTFDYQSPADVGEIRLSDTTLLFNSQIEFVTNETGDDVSISGLDNIQTSDPRILAVVNGDFEGYEVRLVVSHESSSNGQELSSTISLTESGGVVYDPRDIDDNLATSQFNFSVNVTLEKRLAGDSNWVNVSSETVEVQHSPLGSSSLSATFNERIDTAGVNLNRAVDGEIGNLSSDSLQVIVEFDVADPELLNFDGEPDDQAITFRDPVTGVLNYSHEFVGLSGVQPTIQYRVKEWSQGQATWLVTEWQSHQFSEIVAPAVVSLESSDDDSVDGSRQAPVIKGRIFGSPEIADVESIGDYYELSNLTIEFFHDQGNVNDDDEPDGTATTDHWGHFEYTPDIDGYSPSEIKARTKITLYERHCHI